MTNYGCSSKGRAGLAARLAGQQFPAFTTIEAHHEVPKQVNALSDSASVSTARSRAPSMIRLELALDLDYDIAPGTGAAMR